MAHYAKIVDGKVTQVIVAEAEFFDTFVDSSPGQWLQTSYRTHGNQHPESTPLRGNFAGIGYDYDAQLDAFIAPKPYASWILSANVLWEAPVAMPTDGKGYEWNEATTLWKELVTE